MAHIPREVLDRQTVIAELELIHQGKVRDSYALPGHPDKMLVIASDRCSIFDFVLNATVPRKGEILTAMNHFWTTELLVQGGFETDFIAAGAGIDLFLPESLRGRSDLQVRGTVVKRLQEPDVEDIVRICLTGSGWNEYQKGTGEVWGHKVPEGLQNGSLLNPSIYTPTTKAKVGHDEPITAESVAERYGPQREKLAIEAALLCATYAKQSGIILADTKFEFSLTDGQLILADEKVTPDSSRFWDEAEWKKALERGKEPQAFDKQYLRNWGKAALIQKDESGRTREPENPDDLAFVESRAVPVDIIRKTTLIYRHIFWRLTHMRIEDYQRVKMGIDVKPAKRRVEILIGSMSDRLQAVDGIASILDKADVGLHIVSCHRNPRELRALAADRLANADVVIAGAGMAAALPGIVKSELCMLGRSDIPVIGVAFVGGSEFDDTAARLSIEYLPNQPVELDPKGNPYFGSDGFSAACQAAVCKDFLPKGMEAKPAKIGIDPREFVKAHEPVASA